ncbi:hypothetical protein [Weissella cibaria]|uniref:hypothetical protein n=1 Tax=Weissella cibaria TaxID=137591 RepID=UPI0015F394F7|nr:hypothetical protein [Weissella cibaria]QMU88115.1 hypothetical protein H3N00_09090 [Weissella cibaria]
MALPSNQRNGMHFQSMVSGVAKDKQKAVKYVQKGATRRDMLELINAFNAAHPMDLISYR